MPRGRSHKSPAAAGRPAPQQRSAAEPVLVDRRAQALVQRDVHALANGGARVQGLASVQALADTALQRRAVPSTGAAVIQLNGDSTTPYNTHKESGSGASTWDHADAKKQKVWEEMDRDTYQRETADFLGATGDAAVPTTNHVLAKGRLPQFEFSPGNLRFGPNGTLRIDDPDQQPDYGIGHDGALTPRSRAIATAFETGTKQTLKSTIAAQPIREHAATDFDQWYITQEQWDRIGAKWSGRGTFWAEHKASYYPVDYTKATSKGHTGGATVDGLPWVATKLIPAEHRSKFSDLKHFIARGSQIRSPAQRQVATLFQTLRARGAQVKTLLDPLTLRAQFDAATLLQQAEVDLVLSKLAGNAEHSLDTVIAGLGTFSIKIPDAEAVLAERIAGARVEALDAVRRAWTASIDSRIGGRRTVVIKELSDRYRAFIAEQERNWLAEFREAREVRPAPYDLADDAREGHLLALARTALLPALAADKTRKYAGARALTPAEETTALTDFEERLADLQGELTEQIAARARLTAGATYTTASIQAALSGYGIEPLKKARGQTVKADKLNDFRADAEMWLGDGAKWINQFGDKVAPKAANEALHDLVKALRAKHKLP